MLSSFTVLLQNKPVLSYSRCNALRSCSFRLTEFGYDLSVGNGTIFSYLGSLCRRAVNEKLSAATIYNGQNCHERTYQILRGNRLWHSFSLVILVSTAFGQTAII